MTRNAVPRAFAVVAGTLCATAAQAQTDDATATEANDQPVYVVTQDRVYVISEQQRSVLRTHPCKPKGELFFYRAPPGVADHCHGRLFLDWKVTSVATESGTIWDQKTYAVTVGYSLWAYQPRLLRSLLEGEYGGGSGADGAFGYELAVGPTFAVPGPAVRAGTNIVLRGAPEFWHSRWELPLVDLAWVLSDGLLAAELGARVAPVLVGRFDVHDSRESLGVDLLLGPYGVLSHRGPVLRTMLMAQAFRIEHDPTFYELDARLCSGTGGFMLCARAERRWLARGQAWSRATEASSQQTTLGLSAAVTAP